MMLLRGFVITVAIGKSVSDLLRWESMLVGRSIIQYLWVGASIICVAFTGSVTSFQKLGIVSLLREKPGRALGRSSLFAMQIVYLARLRWQRIMCMRRHSS